jgi:ArsR family transcriptional regulator
VNEIERIAKISKAMSDTNRLRIIALIQREKQVCVCEICDTLGLSQPLVSRHLKLLKEIGMLNAAKEGKWVIYTLKKGDSVLLDAYCRLLQNSAHEIPKLVSCTIR